MASLKSCFRMLAGILIMMIAQFDMLAQDPPAPSKNAKSNSSETGKNPASTEKPRTDWTLPPPTLIYLPNKNGELVPVLNNAEFEEYLKFRENRLKPTTGAQSATITKIEITGSADDDRANLRVAYTIRLPQAEEFVSVPLYLNEAILREPPVYVGDGEESPSRNKDPEQGFVWWFRGKGPHRLELSVSVPLRKQLPSRRLVISLPPSPFSRALLKLPYATVNTKVSREQTSIESTSSGESATEILAIDLGSRFDLTWNPAVDLRLNKVSLESQSTIRASIDTEYIQVRAEQIVKSLQGVFDKLDVRLPNGAEYVKLEDSDKMTYQIDSKNPQKASILLKEKSNTAQLTWTMRLPIKSRTVTLDGFAVEGAGKESGRIGLAIAEGLRFSSEPTDPSVLRINAGEFAANMGPVSRAYQFLAQPFKLTTKFDEVKPYFQVRPKLALKASALQLELEGVFEYRVDNDSLNEVVFTWPDYKNEGWTIESVDEPGIVESHSIDDKGQITVRLSRYQASRFAVRVRARRPLKPAEESVFTLPRPKSASRLAPTSITIVNAENVETQLSPRGETLLQQVSSSKVDLPESMQGLKATVFRIDTDEQEFSLRVTPQKQRVRTETLVEASWQDNQFRVTQHFLYDVSYERLSQIRIAVPSSLEAERVRFFTSRDTELTPEILPVPAGTTASATAPHQVLLKLGEAQLGHFEVQARFTIPFAKDSVMDSEAEVTLPIIGSSDAPFSQTRASIVQAEWFDAEPLSPDTWTPQFYRQEARQWLADGSQSSLPLKLVRSTHASGGGNVSHGLIAVHVDPSGQGRVRAQFRVSTRSTALPIQLPVTASLSKLFWDNRPLASREFAESPPESRRFVVQIPEEGNSASIQEHLLTIEYQDRFSSDLRWSENLELRAPQLPKCLWDAEVFWQVALPYGHHLFTYPLSATPMFHWHRSGLIWRRKSEPGSEELRQWVAPNPEKMPPEWDVLVPEAAMNVYSFSQFGSPQTLTFRTMTSSMVLLFGMGFSLVVGFISLRLVVARHVITILLTGLIVAILGLWYSAPLELLLQPMIAGLIFPATAVFLEGWIRQRHDTGLMSFEGQGEFAAINAFESHYAIRQTDPNEATVHRPGTRDSHPSVPVETGSGVS